MVIFVCGVFFINSVRANGLTKRRRQPVAERERERERERETDRQTERQRDEQRAFVLGLCAVCAPTGVRGV